MPKRPMMNLRPQDLKAISIGMELSIVIGGMGFAGHWLDEQWGTDPWLLLTGLMIGTFGGSWHTIKVVNNGKMPDFGFKKSGFKKSGFKKGAQRPGQSLKQPPDSPPVLDDEPGDHDGDRPPAD